jgi:hypothetical protein
MIEKTRQEKRQRAADTASAAGFILNEARGPRRALRTVAAATYLGVSASLLRKFRAMGPDDPGTHGPAYVKISANIVLYEILALDAWLDARRVVPMPRRTTPQQSAAVG